MLFFSQKIMLGGEMDADGPVDKIRSCISAEAQRFRPAFI